MDRATLVIAGTMLASPAFAQTVLTGTYETPNAVSDQSTLCPPNSSGYPGQFTWNPAAAKLVARSAQSSDHLQPRIDQHRIIKGIDRLVATYTSFASGPNCNEPFQAAGSGPYSPTILRQLAAMGCGPFGNVAHRDLFRLWQSGDVFDVYPAVYKGINNYIVLHAQSDYYTGGIVPTFAPNNITIRGITEAGIKPVLLRDNGGAGDSESSKDVLEIENGMNDTIDGLDVQMDSNQPQAAVQASLVYLIGAGTAYYDANGNALSIPLIGGATTFENMHISYAELQQANNTGGADGVLGDSAGGGKVLFFNNEVDHNGGSGVQNSSGIGHGIYINGSLVDPIFTVWAEGNYFHDQFWGHDLKSRAQQTIAIGNYFDEGLPVYGGQGSAFNLDAPNAGQLSVENNIFTHNASGYDSGAFGIAYGEEGIPNDGPSGHPRPLSLSIKHNTFVAFSATEDGVHRLIPMEFFYPGQAPGSAGFPVAAGKTAIMANAFVGYCATGNAAYDYRGNYALIAGFGDLSQTFSFGNRQDDPNTAIIRTFAYTHQSGQYRRTNASIGAED